MSDLSHHLRANAAHDATIGIRREARIAIMAAMETGNHDRARTILAELRNVRGDIAKELELDVIQAYGITL
ncbi:hypothetical protein Axy21_028 [Achromobacter phage vB_AxyP_19-32_Axy21]|uniref:Uncharacterized protein n=1 Tax=Achromobacter phage vB_AxyP_19-32_Axy21 TaxID=2591045 RepID=A0A514CVT7_9CAUD|nr:hypothetical protein Axy21_028 [Achromobacter phage vB_AxyP_19-32_Axy21]